jgi:hypothetical protein
LADAAARVVCGYIVARVQCAQVFLLMLLVDNLFLPRRDGLLASAPSVSTPIDEPVA